MRPAGLDVQAPGNTIIGQGHQRPIGQLSHNLMERHRRHGCRARFFNHRGGFIDNLDVQVGGPELDVIPVGLDQHIGKDRNGIPPFDNRLRLADGF